MSILASRLNELVNMRLRQSAQRSAGGSKRQDVAISLNIFVRNIAGSAQATESNDLLPRDVFREISRSPPLKGGISARVEVDLMRLSPLR